MAGKDPDAQEAIKQTMPNRESPETPLTTGSNTLSNSSLSPKKNVDIDGRRTHLNQNSPLLVNANFANDFEDSTKKSPFELPSTE